MKPIKDQTGAVLMEFVLVLPLLLLLLFASIEFGVAFFNKAMITNASREGARAGIVYNEPARLTIDEIRTIAKDYCETHLITFGDASADDLKIKPLREGDEPGDNLTVTVEYDYDFLVIPNFIPGFDPSITLTGVSVMRNE
ncbi:MAG: TadE/TadG family type IV pilus assembly protein [Desulfobacterales bacterium]|jgi:hypothetical protein|nr:TadE/TadG family type IV pilus assembly protein [Desulfobacterales bacterium]